MSQLVIIRIPREEGGAFSWATWSDGKLGESGRSANLGDLAALRVFARDDVSVAAVLPGEMAAFKTLPSPPRQRSKLMSAALLLLEDELATPIEDQHVAVQRDESFARIVAIDHDCIAEWINRFRDAGVSLDYLTIDFACLGGTAERAVLFAEPNRMMADFGPHAFSAELEIAKHALAERLAALPEAKVSVYAGGSGFSDHSRYERLGDGGEESLFELIGAAISEKRAIDLLQGEFRAPRKAVIDLKRWRRPAMLAASLVVVWFASIMGDGFRASRIAAHYENEAARIHSDAFPSAGNVDIRTHARGVLGAGGDASFLLIADTLGQALERHENVAIDRIRFDRTRNMFVFSVRSTSDSEISMFQETLAAMGAMSAETGGYRRSGAYWVGEMTVTI